MKLKDRIIVALDYPSERAALACVDRLQGEVTYLKVGMQLYFAAGPQIVYALKNRGFQVFVDLKVHDIPSTAKGAMESLASLGADMVNVHVSGGKEMMVAAREGLEKGAAHGHAQPLLIGGTQLTSTTQQVMNDEIGIKGMLDDCVRQYAKLAKEAGLDGVVASPLEVKTIKQYCGTEFLTVTPGVRPLGSDIGDQKRVVTPKEAFSFGTDYIVLGRPITQANDPVLAMQKILETIGG